MKRTLVALGLSLAFSASALAQGGRPSTWTMTCAQAQSLVQRYGSVVMNLSPTVYERIVSHQGGCLHGEVIQPEFAPTRDVAQCHIGGSCRDSSLRRRN